MSDGEEVAVESFNVRRSVGHDSGHCSDNTLHRDDIGRRLEVSLGRLHLDRLVHNVDVVSPALGRVSL